MCKPDWLTDWMETGQRPPSLAAVPRCDTSDPSPFGRGQAPVDNTMRRLRHVQSMPMPLDPRHKPLA